ncbi:MAG TPA: hypothetical protein VMJ32_04485 [Pirellulales bacterium]|nr:hypothetical protein [Pirellulales bacterium]
MTAQIGQVLATYWRRAISGPIAMVAVGLLAFSAIATVASALDGTMTTEMAICTAFLGSAFVGLHFKQQVIQIRQRRFPNGAAAHVVVVVGFLILLAVVLPAANMAFGNWSWGLSGLCLAISAVTFTYFTTPTPFVVLFIPLIILMACLSPVQKWFQELSQGRQEVLGVLLLTASMCGIAATLVWLLQLSDEGSGNFDLSDPKIYSRCDPRPEVSPTRMASFLWRFGTPSERQVPMWPQWARGSLWQRIRQRSVVLRTDGWFSGVLFFATFWGVSFLEPPNLRSSILIVCAFYMVFAPVFNVALVWQQQRPMTIIESLRPVGRSQFLVEMGLTYAYRAAKECLSLSIAWCVLAFVLSAGAPNWSKLLTVLAPTAALQVLSFGLAVWMMRYAYFTFSTALCAFFVAVLMLTPFVDWRNASLGALLPITPGIILAGVLIMWDAYRRWMQTEFG